MNDAEIIELLWKRDETAIAELEQNFGRYCYSISYHIVKNHEDAQECLNDTWLQTWNSIPDKRPPVLRTFVAKIARNLSLNCVIHKKASKRGGGVVQEVYDEMEYMLGGEDEITRMIDRQSFVQRLNGFLGTLESLERSIFVLRFWYFKTPKEIARKFGLKEKTVYNTLYQLRIRFARYWKED